MRWISDWIDAQSEVAKEFELLANKMEQAQYDRIVGYLRTGSYPSSMTKNTQVRLPSLTHLLNRQLMATMWSPLLTQLRLPSLTHLLNRQLMATRWSPLLTQLRLPSLTHLLNRQLMATRPSLPKLTEW